MLKLQKTFAFSKLFRTETNVAVVVQFYPWFKFYFPLCWGLVIYDNEFKTKENKFKSRIKLNHKSLFTG